MEITLEKLRDLSVKAEEWSCRYDIEKEIYEDFLKEHEKVHKFIEDNPTHFASEKEHNEACCLSSFIIVCLLARINEINDSEDS